MIHITVAYATPQRQIEIAVLVEESCTVAAAIQRSGILQQFPTLQLATVIVGVYGKRVSLDARLCDGDRVEIYRPLIIDPKQARLLRAKRAPTKK